MERLSRWGILLGMVALQLIPHAVMASQVPERSTPKSYCDAYAQVEQVGTLTDDVLEEVSGFAASHLNLGIWWTVADSDNPAYLYALHEDGTIQDFYFVSGAANVDWEDLAVAPCPSACACVYLADTGDTALARDVYTLYRFSEPVLGETVRVTAAATALDFTYPDGPHDAETLLLDPRSNTPYLVTKEPKGIALVYALTLSADATTIQSVDRVGQLDLGKEEGEWQQASGGSFAADGTRFVIRTARLLFEYELSVNETLPEALLQAPLRLILPEMPQGEGIGYAPDATRILLNSEQVPSPVYALTCTEGQPSSGTTSALKLACADATTSGPVYGCGCRTTTPGGNTPLMGMLLLLGVVSLKTLRNKRVQVSIDTKRF